MNFFRETLDHLKRFFRVSPTAVPYDLHPNYLSTRFALEQTGLPRIGVQHHHAHIASCMADNGIDGRVIGVALDGTGYGTDGKIWGGEFLVCDFADFHRRGHLAYVSLAGGDAAVRQPWRSALAYLDVAFGSEASPVALPLFEQVDAKQIGFVRKMIARKIQVVETSSGGRLFDAVASLLGICHETTYEGQAAVELESIAGKAQETYPFQFVGNAPFQLDLRPAIRSIVADHVRDVSASQISANFHSTMAQAIVNACVRIRESEVLEQVCLSGGTLQNLRLLSNTVAGLRERGFEVFVHHRVPPNDGGCR